jgi:ubiquinone/menaquinone biosynthesis C-methylase UbiE
MSDNVAFDREAVERLEETYRTPAMVERRERVRALLAPEPGERALSVGAGPGFEPAELAERVAPGGSVTTVDLSRSMLAATRQRAPEVRGCQGTAEALPLAENCVDAALTVQVYEYLRDVPAAAAELARVLRPGGRAVVVATDWDTLVWRADDEERARRLLAAYEDHCEQPRLGSRLAGPLRAAGLTVETVEPYPVLCTAAGEGTFADRLARLVAEYLRGHDAVTDDDVDAWLADLREREAAGETFLSFTQFCYLVRA